MKYIVEVLAEGITCGLTFDTDEQRNAVWNSLNYLRDKEVIHPDTRIIRITEETEDRLIHERPAGQVETVH